ncbi:metallophosphoesterase family protein [Wenyingzhuangia sp. 2_MG-2023]|uniref:metallophosphoesterase family protein n=1 Tax=Wenyingzhuangia sp. 2_MG-2023 TaxID=3062639 RepID=UPI0026E312D4|nr:metallophosphoesterase family protein [Wenyingzhuangia sp. 2_MG-2023]MDO6736591.1 metallophosphoesterase family protein [Wenyingzhuangia sp. 2_MG-2023]MDO6801114.1 metallophosphoesterase family protein [Wenyingzhuangia sp. 1_MG-2023]
MGRTLVIGDIHGGFKALEQILERAEVTTDDKLIFLGDYVDGWSESFEVINLLISLKYSHNCIFLKGNHDELFYEWLHKGKDNPNWLLHGGQATIDSYKDRSYNFIKIHSFFLENLDNYYLDTENRLFLHAGFTNVKGIEQEHFSKLFYWDRSLWETALAARELSKDDEFYPERLKLYKEVYIGHTPLSKINRDEPFFASGVWNVDTGAAFTNPLTIMDIDSKEFWQSDPLPSLYPNEKGRN